MKKYLKIIQLNFINKLDYRQELVLSLFVGILIFSGQAIFWRAVFQTNSEVNGFTYSEILIYYLISRIVSSIIYSRLGFHISDLILSGSISRLLLDPINVKKRLLSEEIGKIISDLIIKIGIYLLLFFLVFRNITFQISFLNFILFIISTIFSLLISFCLFFTSGCIAFWTDNAKTLNNAFRRIMFFLAGGLVPLNFFTNLLQKILNFTPFIYIYDFPIKVMKGSLDYNPLLKGFFSQIIWIIILWIFSDFIFKIAVHKNESVGI